MEPKTRRGFLGTVAGGSTAMLAGCADDDELEQIEEQETEAGGDDEPADGGTLRLSIIDSTQIDPIIKGVGGASQWGESLVNYENGLLPPQPELAESYEISEDGTTFTFYLKEGVTFHNGEEVTASDFVFSWERTVQSEHSENVDHLIGEGFTIAHERDGDELTDYIPGTLAVEAVDEYTFEMELEVPFHSALEQIASETSFMVIPEGFVGDLERDDVDTEGQYELDEAFGTANGGPHLVGTGPFEVESWSEGDSLVLSAYDDYHGEGPYIDGIEYTILPDDQTEYDRGRNGNLDIFNIPRAEIEPDNITIEEELEGRRRIGTYTLPGGQEVNYLELTGLDIEYILFNTERVEKPARQAIAWLINQHDLAEGVFKGLAEPAYAMTPPVVYPRSTADGEITHQEAYDRHTEHGELAETQWGADGYPHGYNEWDIDRAREIMEDAGYSEDNPYEATLTVFSGDSAWEQIAEQLQSRGRSAHLEISIETADFGTIIGEGGIGGNMDFFSLGDYMQWPESDIFLQFLPPEEAQVGFTRWGEEDGDGWATEAMEVAQDAWENQYRPHRGFGEENQQMRDQAYLTIEEVNWEAVQQLPIVYERSLQFWHDDIDYEPAAFMGNEKYNQVRINRD